MADEIQILTTSADGSTWVDVVPNAVSTGYQAQNTNIDAIRNGEDRSSITYDSGSAEIVLSPSGVIDVNGLPFVIKTETRLPISTDGDYYIKIIAGTGSTLRSAELSSSRGTWDASKNAFYDSGLRVLNWLINKTGDYVTIYRLVEENQINGSAKRPEYPWGFVRRGDLPEWLYWQVISDDFLSPGGGAAGPAGIAIDEATGNLVVGNMQTPNTIYICDGISNSVITSFTATGTRLIGLTIDQDNGNIIHSDDNNDLIYVHDGLTSSILTSFAAPAVGVSGLSWDPDTGNLLSSNTGTSLIYVHTGVTSTVLTSFASPSSSPQGLAISKNTKNLISSDPGTDKIYIHKGISSLILDEIGTQDTTTLGLCQTNLCLLSCDQTTDKIYIHGYLE